MCTQLVVQKNEFAASEGEGTGSTPSQLPGPFPAQIEACPDCPVEPPTRKYGTGPLDMCPIDGPTYTDVLMGKGRRKRRA